MPLKHDTINYLQVSRGGVNRQLARRGRGGVIVDVNTFILGLSAPNGDKGNVHHICGGLGCI